MNHFLMAQLGFKSYQSEFVQTVREMGFGEQLETAMRSMRVSEDVSAGHHRSRAIQIFFQFCSVPQNPRLGSEEPCSRSISATNSEFGGELYLNWSEAREMQQAGMVIGGHSHEHRPLATLRYPELYVGFDAEIGS